MPRFILREKPRSPKHDRLVRKLAQELQSPGAQPQPLILESEIPATKSRHVHVIWDDWSKLSEEERADVILDAYSTAEGQNYAEQIAIAIGLTSSEALALGLLPWKVDPILSRRNGLHEADYGRALLGEAKHAVLHPKWIMQHGLRYARQEDAEEAVKRLRRALPGSSWSITKEIYSDS